jgi:hypothetical protein
MPLSSNDSIVVIQYAVVALIEVPKILPA